VKQRFDTFNLVSAYGSDLLSNWLVLVEYFFSIDNLSKILWEGVSDLNEAATRLKVPLSVAQVAFEDGVLKGYWKIADGQLLMHSQSPQTVGAAKGPSPIPLRPIAGPPIRRPVSACYARTERNVASATAILSSE
jgi:hypothetical protein